MAVEDRHWWYVVRRRVMIGLLRKHVPEGASRLLDIGCGCGGNTAAFAALPEVRAVVGADVNPECRAAAAARGLDVRGARGEDLPFADGEFDVVVALDVLEHIDDDAVALREFLRVLADGGTLLLSVPAIPWLRGPHDDLMGHHRRYTRRSLGALLGASRAEVRVCRYFGAILMPAAVPLRLASRMAGSHTGEDRLPPRALNAALRWVFGIEGGAVVAGLPMPPGLSLVAVVRKPPGPAVAGAAS